MKRILSLLVLLVSICFVADAQYIMRVWSPTSLQIFDLKYINRIYSDEYFQGETIGYMSINNELIYVNKDTEVEIDYVDEAKERQVLIDLYNATDGDNWFNNDNWCSDKPLKEWYGVNTFHAGGIRGIILVNNNLKGYIPESIGDLSIIIELDLSNNQLTGEIPETIGNLKDLQGLNLSNNNLTGSIPESIGNYSHINQIDLSYNNLSGIIPSSIANLPIWPQCLYYLTQKEDGLRVVPSYTSTDYSRDGEVQILQKASVGKGIDIVFVGDGYIDKDLNDGGKFDQHMSETLETFFSYEPYTTFRNRFNVYAVRTVSPNIEVFNGAQQAINHDETKVFEYANKVSSLKPEAPRYVVAFCNPEIFYSSAEYAFMYQDESFIAWLHCFGRALVHEVGHGFAKLDDEYCYVGNEDIIFTNYEGLDNSHRINWSMNVDYHSTKEDVIWKHFLNDSRYEGQVGIFEGGFVGRGIYRPAQESMMRYVNAPFNAPSREEIYKRIMRESEGEGWTYDYEEFVKYDEINRNAATRANYVEKLPEVDVENWKRHHKSPVFINKTWREVVEGK